MAPVRHVRPVADNRDVVGGVFGVVGADLLRCGRHRDIDDPHAAVRVGHEGVAAGNGDPESRVGGVDETDLGRRGRVADINNPQPFTLVGNVGVASIHGHRIGRAGVSTDPTSVIDHGWLTSMIRSPELPSAT